MVNWRKAWQKLLSKRVHIASAMLCAIFISAITWALRELFPEGWHKLMDKRVDIVANTISGSLLALLALGSWLLQQKWSRSDEATRRKQHIARLEAERASMSAQALGREIDPDTLTGLVDQFRLWLKNANLLIFDANWKTDECWRTRTVIESVQLPGDTYGQFRTRAKNGVHLELASDIRNTRLPNPNDDSFHWSS